MENSSVYLILFSVLALVWVLPFILILLSNKTSGREKLAWLIAMLFISWFAWIIYLLIAPVIKREF